MSERIDVEYHALRLGLKPALRLTASPEQAPAMEARYRELGLAVATASATVRFKRTVVLYVAPGLADAEGLRELEAPLLLPFLLSDPRVREEAAVRTRELGRLLGYPDCCVAAFTDRMVYRPGERTVNDDYRSARDAQVPAPRWPLNGFLRRWGAFVVSFEPCRFDCPAALRFARALLAGIGGFDPQAVHALRRKLTWDIAIDASGARAAVRFAPDGTVESAAAFHPEDATGTALAKALLERKVDEAGWVEGVPDTVVVRFATSG